MREIWKNHKIIGYTNCTLAEQQAHNADPNAETYISYTQEEKEIIRNGNAAEMIGAGIIKEG